MVIDKTALLRAIREDYRGQGYTVARRSGSDEDGDEDESVLVLDSSDWLVEIEWKNVSPKIIGLIAQHLKGLPRIGEAFTVQEALDSFTVGSAYACFAEARKGKIQPGMLADFVVLNQNPFVQSPSALRNIAVLETYVGGKSVYKKP